MEHTKHLWRAILILLVVLVAFVVCRHFMIPETFGDEGHYRYSSLEEFMAISPRHGSEKACAKCHAEQQKEHDKGKHSSVSCEVCHAPLSAHVKDGEKIALMYSRYHYKRCALCHEALRARPEKFPQVDLRAHPEGLEVTSDEIPAKRCKACHKAHDPAAD